MLWEDKYDYWAYLHMSIFMNPFSSFPTFLLPHFLACTTECGSGSMQVNQGALWKVEP